MPRGAADGPDASAAVCGARAGTGARARADGPARPVTHRPRGGLRRLLAGPLRLAATVAGLVAVWWCAVAVFAPPAYVLPSPPAVAAMLFGEWRFLLRHAGVTGAEILIGLAVGVTAGIATALALASFAPVRRALLPVVIVTQALPVFAIAPLLVVWLGYGMASKIVMASLIIFFPVATAYAEGMLRADRHLLDLARLNRASPLATLLLVRAPAGLPSLAAGLRVAASVAPIGAVVGEWVGASAGLGFVMLRANARLETDMLFAALFLLALMTLALRAAVDAGVRRLAPWAPEAVG